MFNPRPRIQTIPIDDARACCVIDNALLQPERLVNFARASPPFRHGAAQRKSPPA
jgi:hypothetical protein